MVVEHREKHPRQREPKAAPRQQKKTSPIVFHGDLEHIVTTNEAYRRVLFDGSMMQLVVMTLQPGDTIPLEVHDDHDQFIRVQKGRGKVRVGRLPDGSDVSDHPLRDGIGVLIPAGVYHEVLNTSKVRPLRLYSLYSPPEHPPGLLQRRPPRSESHR